MYNCPDCDKEMAMAQQPVVKLIEAKAEGLEYPPKVVCQVVKIYTCAECHTTIAKDETKEYYNNVD